MEEKSQSNLQESLERIKSAYERFVLEVEAAQREHKEKIKEVIKGIEARKIEELRKEIKGW